MSYPASHSPVSGDPRPNGAQYTMDGGVHPQPMRSHASTQEEIVRVQPQEIAPVDPTGETTLHRALNANQVHTFI
jgi:hypothetical protein